MNAVVACSHAKSLLLFRRHLLLTFVNSGYSVKTLSPDIRDEEIEELKSLQVSAKIIPMSRTGLNPLSDIKYLICLFLFFRKHKPDLFFGYTIKPVIFGLIASWLSGVPQRYVMITGLGYVFGKNTFKQRIVGLIGRMFYKLALCKAKLIFFQNEDDRALFLKTHLVRKNRSLTVNGSGVDLKLFPFVELGLNPRMTFLMVARILRSKGIIEYLKAAKIALSKVPKARWILIGQFDEGNPDSLSRKEFNSFLKNSPVEYVGFSNEIQKYMESCTVYVLPSYREGCPRSVLEAMATGRAIITTNVAGCRQTVIDGINGKLVQPNDIVDLANAMIELGNNPKCAKTMGYRSRKIAEEKFNAESISMNMIHKMLPS